MKNKGTLWIILAAVLFLAVSNYEFKTDVEPNLAIKQLPGK